MLLLYILLIIIAIGALLASEAGQSFLGLLIKLVIIGGLLFLGFWIVIIAIAFFTSDIGKSFEWYFLVSIIFIIVFYYGRNYKSINKSIKNTKTATVLYDSIFFNLIQAILLRDFGKIKSVCYNIWKYHKGWIIFIVAFTVLNIYFRYFAY